MYPNQVHAMHVQSPSYIMPSGGDPPIENYQTTVETNAVTASAAKSQQQGLAMKVNQGTRPFVCHICNVSFTRLENLKRHMQKRMSIKIIAPPPLYVIDSNTNSSSKINERKSLNAIYAIKNSQEGTH